MLYGIVSIVHLNRINKKDNIMKDQKHSEGDSFFPRGAIAFFVLLLILSMAIWFGMLDFLIKGAINN
jgi:hypothetical protein